MIKYLKLATILFLGAVIGASTYVYNTLDNKQSLLSFGGPSTQNFLNIQPFVDNTYDNGTSTNAWKNVFTYGLKVSTTTTGCFQGSQTGSFVTAFFTGTDCGSGSGTNFWTNSGIDTFLNTGTFAQAPAFTATSTATSTIANLGGVLYAPAFQDVGEDIGKAINDAYAFCPLKACIIEVPRGQFTFSTPILFAEDGKRALLKGTPAGGTTLTYSGTATSTTINWGIQDTGIDHTSGCGIRDIVFKNTDTATSRATSTNPIIGIEVGGTNGSDCTELTNVDIQGFGFNLWLSANNYNFNFQNGMIRNGGRAVHIAAASNSGELISFNDAFIVDNWATYGAEADNCFYLDHSSVASLLLNGVSIDDCQMWVGQANNVTINGGHWENVGYSAWGKYTYIVIDNNVATNVSINGTTFFNMATTLGNSPDQFFSNGGTLNLNGAIFRRFGGVTIPVAVTLTGSGRVTWTSLNNVSNAVFTEFMTGVPVTLNGSTGTSNFQSMGIATSSNFYQLTVSSTTKPQLSLSMGAGFGQWTFRNAGGNLYLATSTVTGLSTTSISALEIDGTSGTTTLRGLNINGYATSTSNVGFNLTGGCFAIAGICITGGGTGTNYLTNSGVNTFLNTGTFLQAPAITATSSTATSTIAYFNNIFYVPADFATNGCAGSTSNNTLDLCVEALLDLAVTKGLTGATIWITNDVPQSQWVSTIDVDNNGLQVNLFCRPGTRIKYGGSGNAILWNNGDPTGHVKQEIAGCTFMGQNSLIAAGQSNSTTTVGIYYGGGQGAVGINTHDNTFNGFGTQIEVGANAYMLEWNNNGFSGGNSGQTNRGSLVHINVASNSGERNVFDGNNFTDPADGDADNCIYITSGGTASNFFTNNSIDNCQIYAGASNGQVAISYNHFENPGAPSGFAEYIPIVNPSSDQSTQLTIIGNVFANSATNRTWDTIIKHGGQLYAASNNVQNYNGFTITNFADHSNNNGQSSDMICQTQVQGGSLTNIVAGGGGTTWSATNGVPCVYNRANSYSWSIRPLSTNVNQFVSGNSVVADVDHSGNWNLGEDVSNSLVTINKRLLVDTSIAIASSSPFSDLSIGSSNTETFGISTTTNGCAQFTNGRLWITGTACGSGGSPFSGPINSVVTTDASGSLIATGTQLTVGNILATTSATSLFGGTVEAKNVTTKGANATIKLINTNDSATMGGIFSLTYDSLIFGYTDTSSPSYNNQLYIGKLFAGSGTRSVIGTSKKVDVVSAGDLTSIFDNGYGLMSLGTTTNLVYPLVVASSTIPQLSLSAGAGISQWTMRNAGGNFYLATTSVAGTATSTVSALSIIGSSGNVGIGSSTPWASLSLLNSNSTTVPSLSIATSSNSTYGQLVFIHSTTSTLMSAGSNGGVRISEMGTRVGIGLWDYEGFGGLLDQLTVRGRINTEDWLDVKCDNTQIPNLSADGAVTACAGFYFAEDGTGTTAFQVPTGGGAAYTRVAAAVNADGAGVFTSHTTGTGWLTLSSSTPVMETNLRIRNTNSTTTRYFFGFSNVNIAGSTYETEPTVGCYFTASSTQANWIALCRTALATLTMVDTGIASTSVTNGTSGTAYQFRKFRIEADATRARFYIKENEASALNLVAEISTTYPANTLLNAGMHYGIQSINTGSGFDFFRIRFWWRDSLPSS